jgi:hypothetical protein
MLDMQQFNVGGILRGQLMKLDFKSRIIGSIFGTFVWGNGEDLWYMY